MKMGACQGFQIFLLFGKIRKSRNRSKQQRFNTNQRIFLDNNIGIITYIRAASTHMNNRFCLNSHRKHTYVPLHHDVLIFYVHMPLHSLRSQYVISFLQFASQKYLVQVLFSYSASADHKRRHVENFTSSEKIICISLEAYLRHKEFSYIACISFSRCK